jgi:hypothetical protein
MDLAGDLTGAGLDLAHNTIQMAAAEARVVIRRLAVRVALFIVSLVFACLGLLLLLGGGALLLQQSTGMPYWLAMAIVGAAALGVGGFVAVRAMRHLDDPDLLFPATLAEFKLDVQALHGARRRRAAARAESAPEPAEAVR